MTGDSRAARRIAGLPATPGADVGIRGIRIGTDSRKLDEAPQPGSSRQFRQMTRGPDMQAFEGKAGVLDIEARRVHRAVCAVKRGIQRRRVEQIDPHPVDAVKLAGQPATRVARGDAHPCAAREKRLGDAPAEEAGSAEHRVEP